MSEKNKNKSHTKEEIQAVKPKTSVPKSSGGDAPPSRNPLETSDERWRALVELAPDGVITLDMNGFVTSVNSRFLKLTGYEWDEAVGKHALQLGTQSITDVSKHEKILKALVDGEIEFPIEVRFRRKDGKSAWAELRIAEVKVDGVTREIIVNTREITQEKLAAARIRESEAKYKQLFSAISAAVIMFEQETGRIIEVNDTAIEMYGYDAEEWPALKIADLFVERNIVYEAILEPGQDSTFFRHRKKDGTVFPVESSANFFSQDDERYVVFVGRDMTSRRRLEENLQQAQKMEAIGKLAGGIAHDMNNILGIIMGAATTLSLEKNKGDIHEEDLEGILEASRKGAKLTQDFLGFARKGKYVKETIFLNDVIKKITELMVRTISKRITCTTVFDDDLWCMEGDASQIDNVLMNICVNAADAMQGKGKLTITTRNVVLRSTAMDEAETIEPGKYVQVKIVDTGVGMDPQTITQVFEPYFTTKPEGKGTGLGLSMVYGVVKNHNGEVTIESDVGKGTVVKILFPAFEQGVPQKPEEVISRIPVPGQMQGAILVVDDESMMLNSTRRMLEKVGYQVVSADRGRKAIEIYKERGKEIGLVLLDFMMPEMDGPETFAALVKIDPNVRVILSSGYSIDDKIGSLLQNGLKGFIQKPFDLNSLIKEIEQASKRVGED